MPTLTIEYTTESERLQLERLIAYSAELRQVAAVAESGGVLAACEAHVLDAGRRLLREHLQATVQAHIDQPQKKRRGAARKAAAPAP
jgi:hypothetical protein